MEVSIQDHDNEDHHSSWDDSVEFKLGFEDDLLYEALQKLDEKISPLELDLDFKNIFEPDKST